MSNHNVQSGAHAVHLKDDESHLYLLADIQVFVNETSDGWFAQGVEIDYFACGESLEDLQKRFTEGLTETIKEHLRRYNSIEHILKWAPSEVREKIIQRHKSKQYKYSMIDSCRIETDEMPISLTYIKEEENPTAA